MTAPTLEREEYIEQAYLFRVYHERLDKNLPAQEILSTIGEEVLATTKLPLAIDFLKGELLLTGRVGDGMARLPHYFTPFQTFVISKAEDDRSRFDMRIALKMLEREAEYLAGTPIPTGLFVYQFECVSRNRLGYDGGMTAMAGDPYYNDEWSDWILKTRLRLGTTDFADLIFYRSQHYVDDRRRRTGNPDYTVSYPILFGAQEGRIAQANRGKDPLFMFAALQRQLGYPSVPRARAKPTAPVFHPALEERLKRIEKRLAIFESELKDEFDLSEYYVKPPDVGERDS